VTPPRRSYRSTNLPKELAEWLDQQVHGGADGKKGGPGGGPWGRILGVQSRDEAVRLAIAVLALALHRDETGVPSLQRVQDIVTALEESVPQKPDDSESRP
jgi:hypothetical protein